ncbi:formimidoylglutamase [Pseudalkalibacillus salsuginis]|uniref:formimidoylglutamase n=1 Tax=Pseudalkalibacillus salsuginis TaxID=2910972 RepID=UPI001F247210|nr:formimidoylglutamase [Pseudalkalibacillus salsuginis]MCF6411153.1 formimidoylglutamase [Pseudalkalibacillus salsuginis]
MGKFPYLKKAGEAGFRDSQVIKAHEIIHPWDGESQISGIGLIGAPLSKPSISLSGASQTPGVIRQMFSTLSTYAIEQETDLAEETITDFGDVEMHLTDIPASHDRIYETLTSVLKDQPGLVPIVLGGDHSISYPSIRAFSENRRKVGIIQFDAHHDLRNREDGGTGNGTPFRALIEEGVISGDQLIQIGIRNFSNSQPYHQYGKDHGVTIYTMKDVREQRLTDILHQSIQQLKAHVDFIYVSLDMDVLDQAFAPGCPAIGPGGMTSDDLLEGIEMLAKEPMVKGMDIVEIDPTVDFRNMTSKLAAFIILTFMLHRG